MNSDFYDMKLLSEHELIWSYARGAMQDHEDEGWDLDEAESTKISYIEIERAVRFLESERAKAEEAGAERVRKTIDESALKKVHEENQKRSRRVVSDVSAELDELKELFSVLLDDAQEIPHEDSEDIARAEGESEAYAYVISQLNQAREKIDRALAELEDKNQETP